MVTVSNIKLISLKDLNEGHTTTNMVIEFQTSKYIHMGIELTNIYNKVLNIFWGGTDHSKEQWS